MRFMKKLLLAVYLYIGVFGVICLVMWIITHEEPTSLIAGVFGAAGVESLISGIMRMSENRAERVARLREQQGEQQSDADEKPDGDPEQTNLENDDIIDLD